MLRDELIDFQSDLLAVQANLRDDELYGKILCKIAKCNIYELTESSKSIEERQLVAELFYTTLKEIQSTEDNSLIDKLKDVIMTAFENISQIAKSGKDCPCLIIIDFLNDLYQRRRDLSSQIKIDQDELVVLLSDLDNIKFIFGLSDNDNCRYFPINRLLSNIILSHDFINTKIEPYHINILQLAVEMFKVTHDSYSEKFNELIKTCNLQFINYLDNPFSRIDTSDMSNYLHNHVMIFYDIYSQNVLIRHEDKNYFSDVSSDTIVEHETNMSGRPIGYFVKRHIEGKAIDYSEAIKESPKEFLKLLYEKKCKNVLIEKMILKTPDGKFEPLNPFCKNDKWIIKGKINGREGKWGSLDTVIDNIEEGRLQLFSEGNRHKLLDQLSLGLCLHLLEHSYVEIDTLFSDLERDDWIQNIILENWVNNSGQGYDSLEYALEKYVDDLDYCLKEDDIGKLIFDKKKIRDVLPYFFSLKWVYKFLDLPKNESIFVGTIIKEDEFSEIEFSKANKSVAKIHHSDITSITSNDVCLSEDTDSENFYQDGCKRYFVFKDGKWFSSLPLENIYKIIVEIELINYKMLRLDLNNCINENSFSFIKEIMNLHQKELSDIQITKVDKESLFIIRLANNLLLNKIKSDNWESYFNLFKKHQIIKFDEINHDDCFCKKEEGVLVVPKDKASEDAVLRKIYENYIRTNARRDTDWWYSDKPLSLKKDKFYSNQRVIEKIRFLFDNTEKGTATVRAIAAYLGKKDEWIKFKLSRTNKTKEQLLKEYDKQSKKCKQYKCDDGRNVNVEDVILKNKPIIEAHSYFGTEEGDKNIREFLVFCGFQEREFSVSHNKEIINKSSLVKEECEKLGLDYNENIYVIIREFNMPQLSLLPRGTVGKADRVVTLLVRKD